MSAKIEVLLPVITKKGAERAPNPLPTTLHGKVVGFLDNGTGPATAPLYERMAELLLKNHQVSEIVSRRKPFSKAGQKAPGDILDELARKCDLVINGVGL
ncbi:MAG: hypothetical protein ABIH46_14250 [Chloroflexota bacterium]